MTLKATTLLPVFFTLLIVGAATTLYAAEPQRCPDAQTQPTDHAQHPTVAQDSYKLSDHVDRFYWFVREFGG